MVYLKTGDVTPYLDEIADLGLGTREIAFTGGEPFMNPDMVPILEACLERGFEALVLTNAMRPLMRPRVQTGLTDLRARFGDRLSLRISIDHYTAERHEAERGPRTFGEMLKGIAWLAAQGFPLSVAGRTCWGESDATARTGYRDLFARLGLVIDADDPGTLILFPEMDERVDVPEITTGCWKILGLSPADIMCASSRMIVKHQGDAAPTVMPCTLLPYDRSFGMGETLSNSLKADGGNFARGAIKLNHPHCAKFCVLGGGSCSAG
ncbi:MAG: radical SAM protein [Pseudomonadota bacterium]